ncbi:MAG: hypothetical protein GTN69_02435 [Armatimonadetes bacterium]|nr:hypothetical protein [Armatimonadota bacterium]
MDSEKTKKQIETIDEDLHDGYEEGGRMGAFAPDELLAICQAKLALVKTLEIQVRMEKGNGR